MAKKKETEKKPEGEKTLLVIVPESHNDVQDCIYTLVNSETGEGLASHWCSNSAFAKADLYFNRPERIKKYSERFGEVEVKFIDDTDVDPQVLLALNKEFHTEHEEER